MVPEILLCLHWLRGTHGLPFLSSGLTRHELREMVKFKVFGTVLLENVPQIIFYVFAIGKVTDSFLFAFVASILSIISSSLSYIIDRDQAHLEHVAYYVALQHDGQDTEAVDIADTRNVLKNRGRTLALSRALAALWHVQPKSLEVGSTILTESGAITHIVHSVSRSELAVFAASCSSASCSCLPSTTYRGFSATTSDSIEISVPHCTIRANTEAVACCSWWATS